MNQANEVIQAVKQDRNILYETVKHRTITAECKKTRDQAQYQSVDYLLSTHRVFSTEYLAFTNIRKEAFASWRYVTASPNRQRQYRRYMTRIEREVQRQEAKYLLHSRLRGRAMLEEIARVISIKFKSVYTWKDVKGILDISSQILTELEQITNLNSPQLQ